MSTHNISVCTEIRKNIYLIPTFIGSLTTSLEKQWEYCCISCLSGRERMMIKSISGSISPRKNVALSTIFFHGD